MGASNDKLDKSVRVGLGAFLLAVANEYPEIDLFNIPVIDPITIERLTECVRQALGDYNV